MSEQSTPAELPAFLRGAARRGAFPSAPRVASAGAEGVGEVGAPLQQVTQGSQGMSELQQLDNLLGLATDAGVVAAAGDSGDAPPPSAAQANTPDVASVVPPFLRTAGAAGGAAEPVSRPWQEAKVAYVDPPALQALAGQAGPRPSVRALRADVNAINVVTELASAIAGHPGSTADPLQKSALLREMCVLVFEESRQLVRMVAPENADSPWLRARAMALVAGELRRSWAQDGESATLEAQRARSQGRLQILRELFEVANDEALEALLSDLANGSSYKSVSSARSFADHRVASLQDLAWGLSEAVDSVRDETGEVFSFGLPGHVVVADLLARLYESVRVGVPAISDGEALTTYWRGALRRATHLAVAEYRREARQALDHVQDAPDPTERAVRLERLRERFSPVIALNINVQVASALRGIERAARTLIDTIIQEGRQHDAPQQGASPATDR